MKTDLGLKEKQAQDGAQDQLQQELAALGQPPLTPVQAEAFAVYLKLLMRWNAKMNLTAIRNPGLMIRRHFVESINCARLLPEGIKTLLDYGSGAGLPGVPCAICHPEVQVTLADSQVKKAAFLREAVRCLGLRASVYHGRVEEMDSGVSFDAVTLRAVDRMQEACQHALARVKPGGWLVILTTRDALDALANALGGLTWRSEPLARSKQELVLIGRRE